jgi:hypothetical protein
MEFEQIAQVMWLAFGAASVGLVARLVRRGADLLLAQEARIRNAALRDALTFATVEAEQAAETVVASLNQTIVNERKLRGGWDAAAARAVKEQAMRLVRARLSADAKAVLERAVGDLAAYLDALVEAKVASAPTRVAATSRPDAMRPRVGAYVDARRRDDRPA